MPSQDWVSQVADDVERHAAEHHRDDIVCASGISPSGPIHLGNLREVMTVHLVADELARRGRKVSHLHSWDDFDRLRKLPPGTPERFVEQVGRPISDVPDPQGEFDSWASRFIAEFEGAATRMGIRPRWIRQSVAYRAGTYNAAIARAMDARLEIFDVLARYQTEKIQEVPREERRAAFWPFQVYCEQCGRDSTTITSWDPATTRIGYRCATCGERSFLLSERTAGKLVWKVDWPMRWVHEGVVFEPGGEDHSSPGGSYTVGKEVVATVFGGVAPCYVGYGFVGMAGRTKMSSSAGDNATPEFALRFIEPAILRWLYVRRRPERKFTIDFGSEIWRSYDEWDTLSGKASQEGPDAASALEVSRSAMPMSGAVSRPERPIPFRVLSAAAEMTQCDEAQILRIVAAHLEHPPVAAILRAEIQPRLDCAAGWVANCLPDDERLAVRTTFDADVWATLGDEVRQSIELLAGGLDTAWTLEGLTRLAYGAPKLARGLALDTEPTPELKKLQREVFAGIYRLILGADTGPRLPTLFLSLGSERVKTLLAPPALPA